MITYNFNLYGYKSIITAIFVGYYTFYKLIKIHIEIRLINSILHDKAVSKRSI